MKTKVSLEELEMWAAAYPNLTIVEFIKILSNRTS